MGNACRPLTDEEFNAWLGAVECTKAAFSQAKAGTPHTPRTDAVQPHPAAAVVLGGGGH